MVVPITEILSNRIVLLNSRDTVGVANKTACRVEFTAFNAWLKLVSRSRMNHTAIKDINPSRGESFTAKKTYASFFSLGVSSSDGNFSGFVGFLGFEF